MKLCSAKVTPSRLTIKPSTLPQESCRSSASLRQCNLLFNSNNKPHKFTRPVSVKLQKSNTNCTLSLSKNIFESCLRSCLKEAHWWILKGGSQAFLIATRDTLSMSEHSWQWKQYLEYQVSRSGGQRQILSSVAPRVWDFIFSNTQASTDPAVAALSGARPSSSL